MHDFRVLLTTFVEVKFLWYVSSKFGDIFIIIDTPTPKRFTTIPAYDR